jgi:hypothetical protein
MVWMRVVCLGIVSTVVLGCSSNDGERPTAPVKVVVKYKGNPVEGAMVTFISMEAPQPAVGRTDASGNCSLTTYKTNDGAIVGGNIVTISKQDIDKTNIKPLKPEDADLIGVAPIPTLKNLLPAKYALPGTSGLKEDVKKGSNSFTYELKD